MGRCIRATRSIPMMLSKTGNATMAGVRSGGVRTCALLPEKRSTPMQSSTNIGPFEGVDFAS